MLYASTKYGKRRAEPGLEAWCPGCNGELIPKCGEILIHHWAHKRDMGCDWDTGKMSQWHMEWQSHFSAEQVEVVIGKHRADIVTSKGVVIELQHSSIDKETIRAREQTYPKMVWIIDVSGFKQNINTYLGKTFTWSWARNSWEDAEKRILLDFGDGRIYVIQEWEYQPRSGYGYFVNKTDVLHWMRTGEIWQIPEWAKYTAEERKQLFIDKKRAVRSELNLREIHAPKEYIDYLDITEAKHYDKYGSNDFDYDEWMQRRERTDQQHYEMKTEEYKRGLAAVIGRWHYERKIREMYGRWCKRVLG